MSPAPKSVEEWIKEIAELRQESPVEALCTLVRVAQDFDRRGESFEIDKLALSHLVHRSCLLLEAGRDCVQNKRSGTPLASNEVAALEWLSNAGANKESVWLNWGPLRLRAKLLLGLLGDPTTDELEKSLNEVLQGHASRWGINKDLLPLWQERREASWRKLLSPKLTRLEGLSRWHELFVKYENQSGAWHPGLHALGETIAYLYARDPVRHVDFSVRTWVLLAENNSGASARSQRENRTCIPGGYAVILRIERLAGGGGYIFPDPAEMNGMGLAADFTGGIVQAMKAVIDVLEGEQKSTAEFFQYDYRWRLEHREELPFTALGGPSASLPFAAGLLASVKSEDLDLGIASTGQFEAESLAVIPVGGVLQKSSSGVFKDETKLFKDVTKLRPTVGQILVAFDQPVESHENIRSPTKLFDTGITAVPVKSLAEAYEKLCRNTRITRAVKGYLQRRSARLLKHLCKPYVRPRICRQRKAEQGKQVLGDLREQLETLSAKQLEKRGLFNGEFWSRRLQLFADSGFGKTTLLVELENQIAAASNQLVPLRLGAGVERVIRTRGQVKEIDLRPLANQDFQGSLKTVAAKLAIHLYPRQWRGDKTGEQFKPEEIAAWLEHKLRCGEIVWLLDAVDQSGDDLDRLAEFLEAPSTGLCKALITGRNETPFTKVKVWSQTHWETLHLGGFGQEEWLDYYCRDDAGKTVSGRRDRAEEIWGKEDWQPLLEPPLVAQQMKELDIAGKLDGLETRYEVYSAALSQLALKGVVALGESEWTIDEILGEVLPRLAWAILRHGPAEELFTARIAGTAFAQVLKDLQQGSRPITWELLSRFNLTRATLAVHGTKNVVQAKAQQENRGLAWRHRSFFEYFAGRALAERQGEYAKYAAQRAHDPQWNWTLRFALAHAATLGQEQVDTLARELMAAGNPFVVADAMRDGVQLSKGLQQLCVWLVRRDWDYRPEDGKVVPPPPVNSETVDLLGRMFVWETRDSRYLHAAWELVEEGLKSSDTEDSVLSRLEKIRDGFLGEFAKFEGEGKDTAKGKAAISLIESFVCCPPQAGSDPFVQGELDGDSDARAHPVKVDPFKMQRFPITNGQFELLAPKRRNYRTSYNKRKCQPAVGVTWFEASLFAMWLGQGGNRTFRLPTEAEWEYACRAGSTGKFCRIVDTSKQEGYRDLNKDEELGLVASYDMKIGRTTTLAEALRQKRLPNLWGLFDMHGNVWEWCGDWYDKNRLFRVDRGGSFYCSAGSCRAAYRQGSLPEGRGSPRGFRLALVPSSPVKQE